MARLHHLLRKPDDGGAGGSEGAGSGGAADGAAGASAAAGADAGKSDAGAAAAPGQGGTTGGAGASAAAAKGDTDVGSGAAGAKTDDKGSEPSWRPDWRQVMAKGDEKVLKRLERYASPEALSDALIHAQNRITSGELKPALKKNATDAELAEWRAANGVPESPDKYDLGIKPTAEAQALLDVFLPIAHKANMTPDQVKGTLSFIAAANKAEQVARAEKDVALEDAGEELLRAEWGGEYKRNITFIHNLLDGAASPEFKESLLGGRLADGTPIGSSPEALRFLMGLALVQNPTGTLVPGFNNNPAQGVDEEIAKIETTMRTDRATYNKDEKMQSRYRELLDAREKLKKRA